MGYTPGIKADSFIVCDGKKCALQKAKERRIVLATVKEISYKNGGRMSRSIRGEENKSKCK